MYFLFDTNVLLYYLRENDRSKEITRIHNPFGVGNTPILSIVSVGEIESIALRNHWGISKLAELQRLIGLFILADIHSDDVIQHYAQIDTFSQGQSKTHTLGTSARNMGKNDLWIAATAAAIGAKLLTSDNDFDHLIGVYVDVIKV
jgi:predicted nucleic acid-binding protein